MVAGVEDLMTGVREFNSTWGACATGVVLAAAAVWLARVDAVLPPPAATSRQISTGASRESSRCLWMRLEDAAGRPGAVVRGVEPASPAARAGVQPGDILVFVDDQLAGNARQAGEILQGSRPGRRLMLELVRAGAPLVLVVDTRGNQKSEHAGP